MPHVDAHAATQMNREALRMGIMVTPMMPRDCILPEVR